MEAWPCSRLMSSTTPRSVRLGGLLVGGWGAGAQIALAWPSSAQPSGDPEGRKRVLPRRSRCTRVQPILLQIAFALHRPAVRPAAAALEMSIRN